MKKGFLFFTILSLGTSASALPLAQYLNFDGQLLNSADQPITANTSVVFEIYDPNGTCLLYRETQSITPDAFGEFSTKIGPSGSGTASADDGNISWSHIFQNSAQVRASGGAFCMTGYTPAASDSRRLRVTVAGTVLTPDYILAPAPSATVAETLQGKVPEDFLPAAPQSGVSQLNASLQIQNNHPLRFTDTASSNFVSLRAPTTFTSYSLMLPPTAGNPGQFLQTDGTGILTWANGGGGSGITQINGLTASTQTLQVSTTGTALTWDSASGVHNLIIPMAANTGVTAGLISKSDYDSFTNKLSQSGGTLTGNLQMNNNRITNLADPSGPTDAATRNFVETALASISSSNIADGSVGTVDLANGSVTDDKIVSMSANKLIGGGCADTQVLRWNGSTWGCSNTLVTGSASGQAVAVNSIPNCSATQKLQMNSGPVFSFSCANDNTIGTGSAASPSLFFSNETTTGLFSPIAGVLAITTGGSEKLRIDSDAMVLQSEIGPAVFALKSYNTDAPVLKLSAGPGTISGGLSSYPNTGQTLGRMIFGNHDNAAGSSIESSATITHSAFSAGSDLKFSTIPNAGNTPAVRMLISDNGRVGVNTTSPSTTLDVNGLLRLRKQPSGSAPSVGCTTPTEGTIALTNTNIMCVCTGTTWVQVNDGATSCTW